MITQTITEKEFNREIANFTGTENYHKASMLYNLKLTDGIQYLRDTLNCYWLIDIAGSVQHLSKIKANSSFIIWKIEVKGSKGIVYAYKDSPFNKENLLYKQEILYTDFPFNFEFYQVNDVLLLKGEY